MWVFVSHPWMLMYRSSMMGGRGGGGRLSVVGCSKLEMQRDGKRVRFCVMKPQSSLL